MAESFLVGIDVGTGSCKTMVVSAAGRVLGFGAAPYPAKDTHARWQEQDPDGLVTSAATAVRHALKDAGVQPEHCAGVSVGGALHSVMALSPRDTPLTGVITWADTRAAAQAESLRGRTDAHALYHRTGCPVHALYPREKIIWLREERPEVFDQAGWFISGKEYVTLKLTGRRMVDYSIAGGSGLLNTHTLEWDATALDLAGITPERLFQLTSPEQILGVLRPELAGMMGLPASTPVVAGSSDAVNSSLGAGAVRPGQVTCMVGTSGAVRIIAPHPILDPEARSWCYSISPEHWLVGGAINNGGLVLQWLRDMFADISGDNLSFDDLAHWAEKASSGAEGLLFLPLLTGERSPYWDPNARGVLFGLSLTHDRHHIARAAIEGVCFLLRSLIDILHEATGQTREVRASGGFAQSGFWLQTTANVLGRAILVPEWGETSSLGAAFWAMRGAGYLTSLDEMGSLVKVGAAYHPELEEVDRYQRLYAVYKQLYPALKDLFRTLAAYQQEG